VSQRARAAAAELGAWVAENEDLLRLAGESFDHEGEWPQAAQLTRRHFASRPRRDYAPGSQTHRAQQIRWVQSGHGRQRDPHTSPTHSRIA